MELRINEARKKNNKQSRKNSSASNSNIIKELDSSGGKLPLSRFYKNILEEPQLKF